MPPAGSSSHSPASLSKSPTNIAHGRAAIDRYFAESGRGSLPDGLIFEIARRGGLEFQVKGSKVPIRCPLHDDRRASAFISSSNVFYCSACTPSGGMRAKDFAAHLKVDFKQVLDDLRPTRVRKKQDGRQEFGPAEAICAWEIARAASQASEERRLAVGAPLEYLQRRGLAAAFSLGLAGAVEFGDQVPLSISRWAQAGYQIIAPLYDKLGVIANIQGRSISERVPKTMNPSGSRVKGTLFANEPGLGILRNQEVEARIAILGEGMTDFLALAIASPIPVFSAPGTPFVVPAIGAWAKGRDIVLALDMDEAAAVVRNPAAQMAYRFGAKSVRTLKWPDGCKDACDVLALLGVEKFRAFLDLRINRTNAARQSDVD